MESEGTNTMFSIVFAAIFLVCILLGVVVVVGGLQNANNDFNGGRDISISNETGTLDDSGYELQRGDTNFQVLEVIKRSDNSTLGSGNYTLVGNKLYPTANATC